MLNQVILESRIVRNAGLQISKNGNAYISLTVVFETAIKVESKWEKKSNFISAFLWGTRARRLVSSLRPGKAVILRGRLQQSEWENDEGKSQKNFFLNVEELHFMKKARLISFD